MATRLFEAHGRFCATHPWEVIVGTLTVSAYMLSLERPAAEPARAAPPPCAPSPWLESERDAADMIAMTSIRCVAVLYGYHRFATLRRSASRHVLVASGLFAVFTSFAFTSALLGARGARAADLKDAPFFFVLLTDVGKIARLAQHALASSDQGDVALNISRGMATLGPAITLDALVETLVIGVGALSGVARLEAACAHAAASVVVDYVVFVTLYPACLSLVLELSKRSDYEAMHEDATASLRRAPRPPNQVVQRIKLIMAVGLALVHAHSRRRSDAAADDAPATTRDANCTESAPQPYYGSLLRWLTTNADQIVILILLLALAVKFVVFESPGGDIDDDVDRIESHDVAVQTDETARRPDKRSRAPAASPPQQPTVVVDSDETIERLAARLASDGADALDDAELASLVAAARLPFHGVERAVGCVARGVRVRRLALERLCGAGFDELPHVGYDYARIRDRCCENVVGYVPVPVGVAGPLRLDGACVYVPMATTEGCLVASTNRGCRALFECGVTSRVVADGMTRGPVVRFASAARASEAVAWFGDPRNFAAMKSAFDSTSGYARLTRVRARIAGRHVFVRFVATTGDAMGMNMVSKGAERALDEIRARHLVDMEVVSLSGNVCADKKSAAVNWIDGRGKSVVCDAVVPAATVAAVLKTSVRALVDANVSKNLIGSAVAGAATGGCNAHAANVVTAVYIATGQDPAQNVTSSSCMTLMEPWGERGDDLYVSCTMPSIEIGTVGGGTVLAAQGACLDVLGVRGAGADVGANATRLARIVCGAVLAGELSLMAALAAGHLVDSHLAYNRRRSDPAVPETETADPR